MHPAKILPSLCLLLVVLMAAGPALAQGNGDLPYFEYDNCPFDAPPGYEEGQDFECGYLAVPENRGAPGSATIYLAVVIVYSQTAPPLPDPIVYLEGGPGGSAITGLDAWLPSPYRLDRDIILIDQRGTGFSEPSLNCPEIDEAAEDDDPERACYQRLVDEGIDLSGYNSRENAADINDLRLALDLDTINLYGVSYGTRLALTVMRDHPAGIRSVVLDSTFPPQVNGYVEQALNGARAFDQLFADCAADPACNAAFPNLAQTFYALVDDLNASPALVEYEDGPEEVTGDMLVDALFNTLYSTAAIPGLPYGIALLAEGETDIGLGLLSGEFTGAEADILLNGGDLPEGGEPVLDADVFYPWDNDGDAEGMFNAVECYEEIHFQTFDQAVAASAGITAQLQGALIASLEGAFASCDTWQAGRSGPIENQPVVSDIPTLILAGSYDPITPPAWGLAAGEYLSRSLFFEFPGVGHGAIDGGDCPLNIGLACVDNPLAAPDSRCVDAMRVTFYAP